MNFLEALKKSSAVVRVKEEKMPDINQEEDVSVDEAYRLNVIDSVKAYNLPELQLLCEEFIKESLLVEKPLISRHHTGYDNFTVKIMNLFEEYTTVEVTEKEPEVTEEDSDSDMDPSDIIYKNNDGF